jgi:glycosyltransferase involved in cell wall biosynthesis
VFFTTDDEANLAAKSFAPFCVNGRVVAYGTASPPPPPDSNAQILRGRITSLGDRPYILFLSRIHEKKGCDILIEAFARIANDAPELDLVIAGPDQAGLQVRLEARAEELGIQRRVHWPGMLRGDEKWSAFYGAKAFALPSHTENFGIVVAEAMACGVPVLTTDKVNIWRYISNAGAGLISNDTTDSFTEILSEFIRTPAPMRSQMGEKGKVAFRQHMEIEAATKHLIKTIEDELQGRGAPGSDSGLVRSPLRIWG